ncbi:MAG: tripartite tricarboxylate transporter permease [Proteobacteria bacterium]|jgi:putative tricarboxylic transport membrane protein|uniref:tripartite tricarboxylate transporter permease n=1 Tax=Candidatus Puniceispirillum sp. TaxID=2026719 RepID=UPI000A70D912|nr:Tat pathway signal protein [Candidatus Puniceispirillum sp.]MDA0801560.1 tripartite tricarboxylate transporter permease [Pseudomonadota bacterium]MDA8943462.1 tripartite tricarboxylate transporter permease [Alphaproteobacteria bacterium]MDP4633241.1 tripartite tricarboxylate transporter permease [Porticoccaceae bacterium]MDA1150753.1 tripartite tricarboxylate transporter permease [Pseudomonadota bacterium]
MDIFLEALFNIIDPITLIYMVIGVGAGLMAGSIPGFTIAMAIVLTLPFTFSMPPAQGLATMISVLVGGLSGGLMSGILTGIPGTPSSVATTFDGFPMARNGEPGLALGIGVWSSFCGGIISAVLLVLFAPQLAMVGLEFQPWDFFMLVMFALTVTASLAGEHLIKGLIAGAAGLLIRTVGEDEAVGVGRFDFGSDYLLTGFDFIAVLIGLFAFSQLLSDLRNPVTARNALSDRKQVKVKIEHRRAIAILIKNWVVVIRSALIGMFTGILPGAGGSIANILAYDQAKKAAKDDSKFGKGDPRGIIAPETSNNAVEGGALTPLMALGIPGDITAAIMLGALLMHDIVPGPTFIKDEPALAYSIYIAFFLASFIMIGMQSGVLRVFVLVTRIKTYVLATVILTFATIGVFALHNSIEDIWTLFFFGILGFVMRQLGFPLAPMILGVVLGNIAELNLARALAIDADPMLFFVRPWSLFFAIVAVFSMIFPIYQKHRDTGSLIERLFSPLVLLSLSLPLFMMGGFLRTTLAIAAIAISSFILWRRFGSSKSKV